MRWWPDKSSNPKGSRRRYGADVWTARLLRGGLVVLVVASPLLALTALASTPSTPPAAPAAAPVAVRAAAVRSVAAYVTAAAPSDLVGLFDEALLTSPDIELAAAGVPVAVEVAAAAADGAGWLVTVMVIFDHGRAEWYAVALDPGPDRSGWRLGGFPSRVGDPAMLTPTAEVLPQPPAGDARLVAVEAWLRAYLTGVGDLVRLSAPGLRISPLPGPVATDLKVTGFDATAGDSPVVDVALVVTNVDGSAEPLAYRLALAGRDGRWEVAALLPLRPEEA